MNESECKQYNTERNKINYSSLSICSFWNSRSMQLQIFHSHDSINVVKMVIFVIFLTSSIFFVQNRIIDVIKWLFTSLFLYKSLAPANHEYVTCHYIWILENVCSFLIYNVLPTIHWNFVSKMHSAAKSKANVTFVYWMSIEYIFHKYPFCI